MGYENHKINNLCLIKHYLQQMSWGSHVEACDLPCLKRKKGVPSKHVVLNDQDKLEIVKTCHKGMVNAYEPESASKRDEDREGLINKEQMDEGEYISSKDNLVGKHNDIQNIGN
ncbi:25161_t:CDS:2 [Cetraspora pellucida]|uniref:25161_t:CDS:1 n=1 Tax=Cetraspora pellucida TaxID=1433469 RepID=A0A9N9G5P1_9GLOM|nr:25161_t:CDS:2 [Cetraspora pellucida]